MRIAPVRRHALLGAFLVCGIATSGANARPTEAYTLSVNQAASSMTYSFTTANPFTGTLVGSPGDAAAMPPVLPTRLKRGTSSSTSVPLCLFVSGCSSIATNVADSIVISGSITASASTGTTVVRPTGSYVLGLNAGSGAATVRSLSTNLLASGPISAGASLSSMTYQPFCAARGAATSVVCTAPFCGPITIPFGNATVSVLTAVQQGVGTGTLTATGNPNVFDFTVPVTLLVTPTATFDGAPVAADPTVVGAVLSGTVTRDGGQASATSSLTFSTMQSTTPNPPVPGPATALTLPPDSPICANLELVASITPTSTSVNTSATASLVAAGGRLPCKCDADGSGTVTIDDIFVYLNQWFANNPAANFDGLNGITIDDIFLYLNCWFAPPFPC